MKRLLFLLHIGLLILLFIYMPKVYQSHIMSYRQEMPSNLRLAKSELVVRGYFKSINLEKRQGIFISELGKTMISEIDSNTLTQILEGHYNGYLTLNPYERQWNSTKNRGLFDYDAYLYSEGIVGDYSLVQYEADEGDKSHPIIRFKMKALNKTLTLQSQYFKESALALLFSQKQMFSDYDYYKALGILHLFAVSGLHFGAIYLVVRSLVKLPNPFMVALVRLAILFAFMVFIGVSYSAFRAVLAILYIECASLLKRKVDTLSLFSFCNLITLMCFPYAVLSSSYLLSFYVYFVVVFMVPKLMFYFKRGKKIIPLLIIQALTMPITLFVFHSVNLLSFISNFIMIPIYSVLMMLVLVVLPLNLISGLPLEGLVEWLFKLVHEIVIRLPVITYESYGISSITFYTALLGVFAYLILAYSFHIKSVLRQSALFIVIAMPILMGIGLPNAPTLTIDFIDVGHGDGCLITYKGKVIMIDVGSEYAKTLDYLKIHGVDHIDLVILSHSHADHLGALNAIGEALPIDQIIAMEDALEKLSPSLQEIGLIPDDNASLLIQYEDLALQVMSHVSQEENDNGLLTLVSYGNFNGVFTGDYSNETLEEMPIPHQIDLYKVPHHGSKTSYDPNFYASHKIGFTVISHHTMYHFPRPELVETLESLNIPYDSTFTGGQVSIEISRNRMKIKDFFNNDWLIEIPES